MYFQVTEILDTENTADQGEYVDSETTDSLLSLPLAPKARVSKRSKTVDPILERAQRIICDAGEKKARNEYSAFGEHIANKLSKYDAYTCAQAELKIMQILFDCDMGMYRKQCSSISTPLQSPNNDSRSGASTSQSQYLDISHSNSVCYVPPTTDLASTNQSQSTQNTFQHIISPQDNHYASPGHTEFTTNSAYETLVSAIVHQCDE